MHSVRLNTVLAVIAVLLLTATNYASAPNLANYQGRLTDATGTSLSGTFSIKFTIYDNSTMGNSKWSETHSSVMVTDGLFSVLLGSVNTLEDSVFNQPDRYLGVKVGSDPELTPRARLVTSPYAFRVNTIDGATGGIVSGDVTIQSDLAVSGKASIGMGHTASGLWSFVAGLSNTVTGTFATVTGGSSNEASGQSATVSGGVGNLANADWASVGGGNGNSASGTFATVAGGGANLARRYSAVGGGSNNQVNGEYSVIGGGRRNRVNGDYSAVLGGEYDTLNASASYLFGFKKRLDDDSTFMVDMPNVRFKGGDFEVSGGSGDASVRLPSSAISAAEVLDEPGVVQAIATNSVSITGGYLEYLTVSLNQPTSGWVIVTATAALVLRQDQNSSSVEFGVSNGQGVLDLDQRKQINARIRASGQSLNRHIVSAHKAFQVGPGQQNFYIIARNVSGNYAEIHERTITALFVPTSYGSVDQ